MSIHADDVDQLGSKHDALSVRFLWSLFSHMMEFPAHCSYECLLCACNLRPLAEGISFLPLNINPSFSPSKTIKKCSLVHCKLFVSLRMRCNFSATPHSFKLIWLWNFFPVVTPYSNNNFTSLVDCSGYELLRHRHTWVMAIWHVRWESLDNTVISQEFGNLPFIW